MNQFTLLFGVFLCLVLVKARHYGERNVGDLLDSEEEKLRGPKDHSLEARHRRRRWQMNYGYDYSPPSYHYPDRRDYERNDQQVLQQITRLLEEISAYIRRPQPPPPPPQPIYIPYPVPFNYPQIPQAPCNTQKPNDNDQNVNVTRRISDKDMDPNRIWGVAVSNENDYDDGGDGSRPISFDPIVPKQLMKRPAPKVEHGSIQASITTVPPSFLATATSRANAQVSGMCNAAILSCCGTSNNKEQQKQCFGNIGCASIYGEGSACSADSVQNALESFRSAYSPLN